MRLSMFSTIFFRSLSFTLVLAALPACTHTPAGTSVEVALARKPELVRLPPAAATGAAAPGSATRPNPDASSVQPEKTELVADAFSRGEFCMSAGNDDAAISAFSEAVKIDPNFLDA